MKEELKKQGELPDNAFRPLKPGETYTPLIPDAAQPKEVTVWSVAWGILMAVIFSAAAAYLGLKVGQVFEAAIPIAIIAVGLSSATKRKNALLENVMIQSIGASSGVIVAGAIFTLPAIYILQAKYPEISVSFFQVFMSSLLGGILGILLLIPFRKYFVKEKHGEFPFPEATATTQVLVSGEKGGSQAKPLVIAGLVGGLYDFAVSTFGWWHEVFSSRVLPFGEAVADKAKVVFKLNTGAAVLGLGYIIGLKYVAIICAGSFLVWWIIVPGMSLIFNDIVLTFGDPNITATVGSMSAEEIFRTYARDIGIGGIATAGIIGIIRSRSIIASALSLAGKELKGKDGSKAVIEPRTQRDLPMKVIAWGTLLALVMTGVFFYLGVVDNLLFACVGLVLVALIAFLFTTVAANAIAIVGSNPVSGMTLMTLIISSIILVAVGMKGSAGMVSALIIGGVVCTALSMAGGFITDLKIGYWLGSTPLNQQRWKFLGTLVSAATVGGVIMILNKTYGFTDGTLAAPQANAMAALIEPLMSGTSAKWALYGIGAVLAILLTVFKVPALAFALGMFIPLELNTPLLVGGLISWFVSTRSKDADVNKARLEKGTLLASGFIAGGALMGVVSATMRYLEFNFVDRAWLESSASQWVTVLVYLCIITYLVLASKPSSKDKK
ncbi:peptide transporter [Porphyromonas cangingivalis]|uniref:Peptide transporter n=1 Tax=Porphyromonas cangingivalis TaxID=36874 RepID=A0A0A2F493_PORCN|nr:oligopeptide transporter, OPT family [Porphyromonas cangingivalis]KGN83289.1 peptide transporter [Porphyromonas cangingivalis]